MKRQPRTNWAPREIRLLGTAPDRVIAKRLGRSYRSVQVGRKRRGIPAFCPQKNWTRAEDRLFARRDLGPSKVAKRLGRSLPAVLARIRRVRIRARDDKK